MVHKKIFLSILILFPSILFSQFDIDRHFIGPSIGFSFLGSSPQFGLNHEYSLDLNQIGISSNGKLGLGGIFRYWTYSDDFALVEWSYTDIILGFQSNYHFYIPNEDIDPWFGFIFAYDFGSAKDKIKVVGYPVSDKSYGGIWIAANAGIRYWINKKYAISARIGFGTLSYGALDLGFDYKL